MTAKKYLTIKQWDKLATPAEKRALRETVGFSRVYYQQYTGGRRRPVAIRAKEMADATVEITPRRLLGRLQVLYPEEFD